MTLKFGISEDRVSTEENPHTQGRERERGGGGGGGGGGGRLICEYVFSFV